MGRKPNKTPSPKTSDRPSLMPPAESRLTVAAVCGLLLLAVAVVFGQTVQHEFVNFDDDPYVVQNPQIARGLTAQGFVGAFTHGHAGNWHPLTSISHMLDCQFYGLWAPGHHLTNVLLHGATAVLLLLVLRQMTGRLWPSALVAALFAIHPLRVESVAWVAERKDMLSGLFFVLTLAAYVGYARRPFSPARYMLVVTLYALGLMTKPMLVTLPFVLLLLDTWPLGRLTGEGASDGALGNLGRQPLTESHRTCGPASARRLVVEKIPLMLLAAVSCAVTILIQSEAVVARETVSLHRRIPNALMTTFDYLEQLVHPAGLAVFYPYPQEIPPAWQIAVAIVALIAITTAAVIARRRHPYLLVGWLWYLGMLVPVIGLVQVGAQARADRYTYLPQIGVCLALVLTVADITAQWRHRRVGCGIASAIALVSLGWCAFLQTRHWRSSETLWSHTLACTSRNWQACNNLGIVLENQGKLDQAMEYFQKSLEIDSECVESLTNVGMILRRRGQIDDAIAYQRKALAIRPQYARAHNNLANALSQSGRAEEAIRHYEKALEIDPQLSEVHHNCGVALSRIGRFDEAIMHYRKAIELSPGLVPAREHLCIALYFQGKVAEAVAQCRDLLRLQPNQIGALTLAAWALATSADPSIRNGPEAVELAQRAARLPEGQTPETLNTLAAAYAEAGRFAEAADVARHAMRLASARGNAALAAALGSRIELYEAGSPFRDIQPTPPASPPR